MPPGAEVGYPAVVKSAAAGAHETETDGVALELVDEAAVVAVDARIRVRRPELQRREKSW